MALVRRTTLPVGFLVALTLAFACSAARVHLRERLAALRPASQADEPLPGKERPSNLQLDEAFDMAVAHLADFARLAPQWQDATVDKSRAVPVHRPDVNDSIAYFEFPVTGKAGEPAGFVRASTGVHDFPVPHFNTEGLPPTQLLLESLHLDPASPAARRKFYAVDVLTIVVEDEHGRFLGASGPLSGGFPLAKPVLSDRASALLDSENHEGRQDTAETALLEESHAAKTVSADSHWLSWEHMRDDYQRFFGPQIAALEAEARTWWKSDAAPPEVSAAPPERAGPPEVRAGPPEVSAGPPEVSDNDVLPPEQQLTLGAAKPTGDAPTMTFGDDRDDAAPTQSQGLKLTFDAARMISFEGMKREVPVDADVPDFEQEGDKWDAQVASALGGASSSSSDGVNLHDEVDQDDSGVGEGSQPATPPPPSPTQLPDTLRVSSVKGVTALVELDSINDSGSGKPANQIGTIESEWQVRGSLPFDKPDYYQFDYSGCKVGCGPTAVTMLYGWADLQDQGGDPMFRRFSPILRAPGTSKGSALTVAAPQTMTESVKQMARELRDDMGTWCVPFSDNAATNPWSLGDAHKYLARYKKPFAFQTTYHSLGIATDSIRDRAIFHIRHLHNPVVIGVGWLYHYPLAKRYTIFKTSEGRRAYFWAEYGWQGGSGNGYIPASIWAAGYINTNSWWANKFDQPLDFRCPSGQALNAVLSYHSNDYEDRRFSFQCRPVTFNNAPVAMHSCYTTAYLNNWDGAFSFIANQQEVVVGFASVNDNHYEDRRWRFHVCKLANVALTSNCADAAPNEFDQPLDVKCGTNRFIRGVSSYHSNHHEDRRFTIRCCGLTSSLPVALWSGHVNQFDQPLQYACPSGMALGGLSSYHDNHYEDRRWSFFCIRPSAPLKAVVSSSCWWTAFLNDYDAVLNYVTPPGSVVTGAYSVHSNHHEDRRWQLRLCSMTQLTGVCYWTGYVNEMDLPFTFTCPSSHAIRGMYSYHSNHNEDRRWRFYCCKYA